MPDYVQILTCAFHPPSHFCYRGLPTETYLCPGNDYGESSYICDTVPEQIVPGAEKYTVEYPHSALRALLPSFIAAFKAGKSKIQPPERNTAVAWYRTTHCSAGPDGGESCASFSCIQSYAQNLPDTQWGHGGCGSALNGARDVVSVVALTKEPCPLVVSIGEQRWTFQAGTTSSVSYFEVQFDSTMTGPVGISLDGNAAEGPAIVDECCHGQVSLQAPRYSQVFSGRSNTGFSSSSTVSLFGLNDGLSLDPWDPWEDTFVSLWPATYIWGMGKTFYR